jgi:hypothetical protein
MGELVSRAFHQRSQIFVSISGIGQERRTGWRVLADFANNSLK